MEDAVNVSQVQKANHLGHQSTSPLLWLSLASGRHFGRESTQSWSDPALL